MLFRSHRAVIDRKAVTLFSLLFGLGFAIQLQRAQAGSSGGLRIYVRRLVVLSGIGLIHAALIWWGDILLMYALLGLLLIPFRHASDKVLLGTGLILSLIVPPLLTPWMDDLMTSVPALEAMKSQSLPVFRSSSYFEVVGQNVAFATWTYIGWWDDWLFIFGRFLLGFWAGRRGLFHDPSAHRTLIARICVLFAVTRYNRDCAGARSSRDRGGGPRFGEWHRCGRSRNDHARRPARARRSLRNGPGPSVPAARLAQADRNIGSSGAHGLDQLPHAKCSWRVRLLRNRARRRAFTRLSQPTRLRRNPVQLANSVQSMVAITIPIRAHGVGVAMLDLSQTRTNSVSHPDQIMSRGLRVRSHLPAVMAIRSTRPCIACADKGSVSPPENPGDSVPEGETSQQRHE